MEPDLGEIKGMIWASGGVLLRHYLDVESPAGKIALFDASYRSRWWLSRSLATIASASCIGEIFDALLGLQMKLDPVSLILGVDKTECVAAEAVHVAVGTGNTPVAHDDGDLMKASGKEVQKSQLFLALRMLVRGSRFTAWLRSGNLRGSRRKKTGVLLPTRSQLPSSV